ncbi:patatin-like phospholipase family protein [Clostridium sp.]|uniref:patatin-like phospholipase family protein n=1 Tax=Clostridium sp. TaxID=1506 RepID=UPI001A48ACC4|nr:patatin-like phospholipase family protein [Clostridium sp.]MBK5240677.1 patatin-like phospholipase family protein [Clostridium sp.]
MLICNSNLLVVELVSGEKTQAAKPWYISCVIQYCIWGVGKLKIGIALGGGGARGFVHLGVLTALEEKGIIPDIVSGVSAGAIIGAFIASGKKPSEIMELIKDNKFIDYAKLRLPTTGLFSLDNFQKNIERDLPARSFSDLKLPFYVAVTNLYSGKVEYLDEGPLIPEIQASCSIPMLFLPVEINGNLYIDGGLLDNLPCKPLIGKCDKIIAINILACGKIDKIGNLKEIAVRTFELSISINRELAQKECDILIEPTGLENFNILDNSNCKEMFRIGYDYCSKISDLEKLLRD